jgi:hypothetical protein
MKTLTNRELPVVREILGRLNGVPDIKVAYASAKTINKINQEIRDLQQIQKPDEDFIEFNNLLEETKKKWARKRASGEPATKMQRVGDRLVEVYDISEEDQMNYQYDAEKLEKEYLEVVNRQRIKEKNYEEILDEPVKPEFHKVDIKELSHLLSKDSEGNSKLTGAQFFALAFLLKNPKIKMDQIPANITQEDMLGLVEYFDI